MLRLNLHSNLHLSEVQSFVFLLFSLLTTPFTHFLLSNRVSSSSIFYLSLRLRFSLFRGVQILCLCQVGRTWITTFLSFSLTPHPFPRSVDTTLINSFLLRFIHRLLFIVHICKLSERRQYSSTLFFRMKSQDSVERNLGEDYKDYRPSSLLCLDKCNPRSLCLVSLCT